MERYSDKIWTPSKADLLAENIFIKSEVKELGKDVISALVSCSVDYRSRAYTPYSHYNVGASLLTTDGQIFGGCNSESVAYSPTNHAEGSAIAAANSEGASARSRKFIRAVAVCAKGKSGPCGECLQRIVEHADNCLIVVADTDGEIVRITSLKAIFPYNFNPSHLGK